MISRSNDVLVIGAGLSGVLTARALAKKGYKIALVEATDGILTQTSANNCFRIHTGLHYAGDLNTAKLCLQTNFEFINEFSDCVLNHSEKSLQKGRYYFTSDSFAEEKNVRTVIQELKAEYARLVKRTNIQAFGSPDTFVQEIDVKKERFINNSFDQISILYGFEITEPLIDINKLRLRLKNEIFANPNITLYNNTIVDSIRYNSDASFSVKLSNSGRMFHSTFNTIVNCSLQNIEKIEKQLSFVAPKQRVNRIKISALVELPKSLSQLPTFLVGVGPHCSVVNLSKCKAILTYAPLTDYQMSDELDPPTFPSTAEKESIGLGIIKAVSKYIPQILDAKLLKVRCGYVRMNERAESISIYRADSSIHKRRELGAETRSLNYFINAGTKLSFCLSGANYIAKQLHSHEEIAKKIEQEISLTKNKIIKDAKRIYYHRYLYTLARPDEPKEKNKPYTLQLQSSL